MFVLFTVLSIGRVHFPDCNDQHPASLLSNYPLIIRDYFRSHEFQDPGT